MGDGVGGDIGVADTDTGGSQQFLSVDLQAAATDEVAMEEAPVQTDEDLISNLDGATPNEPSVDAMPRDTTQLSPASLNIDIPDTPAPAEDLQPSVDQPDITRTSFVAGECNES